MAKAVLARLEETTKAILSFPPESTGGTDGLTPLHLKDMVMSEGASSGLLSGITLLVNVLMEGVPEVIRPYLFGGR